MTSPLSRSHQEEPSWDWITPALMMLAMREPEVMKSATICPSAVMAVS